MNRSAKAYWSGSLKEGTGNLTTQSGVLYKTRYSYASRFEASGRGTNLEELLAAAHAGCFTMAVSNILTEKNLNSTSLETEATLCTDGLNITRIHLSIMGCISGINSTEFAAIVKDAEKICLISKILSIPVSAEAHFIPECFSVLAPETCTNTN